LSEELKELKSIKKLLILLLQANKVDQADIAKRFWESPNQQSV